MIQYNLEVIFMEITTKSGRVLNLDFAHYGERRELNATEQEKVIAEFVKALAPSSEVVRKSDAYLTVEFEESDVCRFKFTDKAKWLIFPIMEAKQKKHYIENLDDIEQFEDIIEESYQTIIKWHENRK